MHSDHFRSFFLDFTDEGLNIASILGILSALPGVQYRIARLQCEANPSHQPKNSSNTTSIGNIREKMIIYRSLSFFSNRSGIEIDKISTEQIGNENAIISQTLNFNFIGMSTHARACIFADAINILFLKNKTIIIKK